MMDFTGERLVLGATEKRLEIEHLDRYRFAAQFVAGKTVLDAACGTGYGSAIMAHKAEKVVGIDISKEAVEYARMLYGDDKTEFITGSIASLPFPDQSFDVVISFETLEHVNEDVQGNFLREVRRVLRPDGVFVISTPNREVYDERVNNEFHVKELTGTEFHALLTSKFEFVRFFSQKWEIFDVIAGDEATAAQLTDGFDTERAEYLIAVCSARQLPEIFTRVSVEKDGRLDELMRWAVENDRRNTANNTHIAKLDAEIETYRRELTHQRELNESREQKLTELEQSLISSGSLIEQLSANERELNDRIAEQEQELKNRGGHIELLLQSERDLNNRVAEQERELRNRAGQIELLLQSEWDLTHRVAAQEQELKNRDGHIELLLQSERDLNNRIAEREQELNDINAPMERLLRSERELRAELDRIHNSRSWRIMSVFWKLRDILAPRGSTRALILGMIWLFLRHPLKFLGKCTPKRISNFFRTLRREGAGRTSAHLKETVRGLAPPLIDAEPLDIMQIAAEDEDRQIESYEPLTVPARQDPKVSIVIPVYNQFEYTYHCIKSILQHSGRVEYEIIIADDCSGDLTKEIDRVISGLRVIRNTENLRFLRNCNNAAGHARGKYILFLNNDTQVQENWLEPLVELIERSDDIGMVGSKLVYPDGRLQEAGGILWKDGSAWNYGNGADPAMPEYNYVKEADYISGAAIMIRRSLWEEIGGFDELFVPAYCEDSDLAFEVRRRGYKVMYQPLSVVVHFEGVSNGTDLSSGQKAYQVENQKKFFEKWKDVLEAEHFPNGENVFQARDRSARKKTVLMIDHYVPTYDKDAGSRTIYQYIMLLVDLDYQVKFIGDNFAVMQPYTRKLEQLGVEVLYGPVYMQSWKEWLRENHLRICSVFMNRPHISVKYIDEVKKYPEIKVIYNLCDLHFLREKREYEVTGNKEKLASSEYWKEQELSLIGKADKAWTLSTEERDILLQYFPEEKLTLCPINIFRSFPYVHNDRQNTEGLLFVGGFTHTPNVNAVLWFCSEVLPLVREELPDVRFYVAGSNPPEEIMKLQSESIVVTGYISDEELKQLYQTCRVCVIPLRYGAGVKGKTIEAMYYGIPIVSTPTGLEGLPDIDRCISPKTGAEEFAREVVYTYGRDPNALKEKYTDYLSRHYSLEAATALFASEFAGKDRDRPCGT